jgi:hypothetical protein
MAIYDQKCKLSKRTNRQISLALFQLTIALKKTCELHPVDAVTNIGIGWCQILYSQFKIQKLVQKKQHNF